MDKDSKTDQPTKKVRFGGTETVKFNSNDAPKKASKIDFSSAKDVKRNAEAIISNLNQVNSKKIDSNDSKIDYSKAKNIRRNAKARTSTLDQGNTKNVQFKNTEPDLKKANWQAKISEQKNNQEKTR